MGLSFTLIIKRGNIGEKRKGPNEFDYLQVFCEKCYQINLKQKFKDCIYIRYYFIDNREIFDIYLMIS